MADWFHAPDLSEGHRYGPPPGKYKSPGRYDKMLEDIWQCLGHLDWGKFAILQAEFMAKLAVEGWIGHQIDQGTEAMWGSNYIGFGAQSQVQHAGPLDPDHLDSPYGGAWHAVQDPFQIFQTGIDYLNQKLGINQQLVYNPSRTWYGR